MANNRSDDLCWFHGKLSRESAEELVKEDGEGAFLVRESNTAVGDFVLTLLYKGEVCHYQIRRHGEDAFFSMAMDDHDDKVKILHGLDTLVDYYQEASNGLANILTKPIKKDPPPNHSRSHGVTNLLHRATAQNNATVVSELLKVGYRNVDAKNQDGQTALHLAASHCTEPVLRLLLSAGVNVNSMDSAGNMPLHYACRNKKPASFIRALIDANANVQGRNIKNGYVPLHEAARNGNIEAVKVLLEKEAPLLPRTSYGEFPLDLAKEAKQTVIVEFLEKYQTPAPKTFKSQWYHGTLSREEAIETVMRFAENMENSEKQDAAQPVDTSGCFLVRFSERKTGSGYVLTMLWSKDVIKHFIIQQVTNYLYIDDGPYLPSLEHLIEHFMRFSDGLPISLKYPVPPKPKPPLPLFSTMPRGTHRKSTSSVQQQTSPINTSTSPESVEIGKNSSVISGGVISKTPKKNPMESVLNTLKLKSPRKSCLDGMNSLRKNKNKSKASAEENKNDTIGDEEQLRRAEPMLKALSFSTDFPDLQMKNQSPDEFYNVPTNNKSINVPIEVETKTEEEVEYFTKSDIAIERERILSDLPKLVTNANGYVPTVDIRVFWEQSPSADMSQEALEASAAELREFAHHPERLDSLISTSSSDSDIVRHLNRQTSNSSTFSTSTMINQSESSLSQLKLNYFIPSNCLTVGEVIGTGEFGSVHKGTLSRAKAESDEVAIKILRNEHCRSNKQEFLREASMMIRLQHNCVVQFIGISISKLEKGNNLMMMIQELVSLGSMLPYITNNSHNINPNYELKLWASQIASGMEYLQGQHFVHRDLAARNILLSSRNQAKISDFGLSRTLSAENDCYQASKGGKWPIKWYAPESYNNGLFSHASDVWSFGVTLWEMFSLGEPPYGDMRGVDAITLIEAGQRLPQPKLCPNHVYEIMINCWNYKPKDRPSFRYLTEFFAKDPDYQNIILVKTGHIS